MIKTVIIGADTGDGGELIRLLAMHPDVEIIAAQAAGMERRKLSDVHHGLIGETSLSFTAKATLDRCDVLFICDETLPAAEFERIRLSRPDMKIIVMHHRECDADARMGIVYGLPEMHRKELVRGAVTAEVPEAFASMGLVALYPFAKLLMLGGEISIFVKAPEAVTASCNPEQAAAQIERELRATQQSFSGTLKCEVKPSASRRSAMMDIEFDCPLNLQQILDAYEIYDDHRFAFVTTAPVGLSEVAGTNKCVVSVSKPEPGRVALRVVADCRLRGGAGEAVHIMNLLCGLHERTGLALKAIDFDPVSPDLD